MLVQIVEAGLPAPKTEFRFDHQWFKTRHWRFDFCWDLYRLAVEVEGGTWLGKLGGHTSGRGYEVNCEKYNEAVLEGWRVLRVTGTMVKDGRALALIRRGLNQRWLPIAR